MATGGEGEGGSIKTVVIVGAGPAGLATAACLTSRSVPYVILEREDCTASLWKNLTYDCLHLHLPKEFCELPLLPFPQDYPTYPSRDQTVAYLDDYARHFGICPVFNTTVTSAEFSPELGAWVVAADQIQHSAPACATVRFTARFLVVATGENGEPVVPLIPGHAEFDGKIIHGNKYKNGSRYVNQKVLVVGIGNTGMEIALDLTKSGAKPTLVARSPIHLMPRDVFGLNVPTFEVSQLLLDVFPIWVVDKILVLLSWLTLGSTTKYHLVRPEEGPLELKMKTGRTPVLDVGTVAKIKSGEIKVMPAIDSLTATGARFVNGVEKDFDAIIMATGYASTVCKWLKGDGMFGGDGFPMVPYPNGWKGELGLYAVGFGRKGLFGCAHDAVLVAQEIAKACDDAK